MWVNELQEIGLRRGTDKADPVHWLGGGNGCAAYHELFKNRRADVRRVLEIGIGHSIEGRPGFMGKDYHFGASIFMREEYFPNAEIYALDIVPEILINRGRVHSYLCDQGSEDSLKRTIPLLGDGFDLIVDDGSHNPVHQVLTIKMLFPLLGPKGIYICEDIRQDGGCDPASIRNSLTESGYKFEMKEFRAKPEFADLSKPADTMWIVLRAEENVKKFRGDKC